MKNPKQTAVLVGVSAATAFLGVSFFVWTFVPYAQMVRYAKTAKLEIIAVAEHSGIFTPFTYAQPDIRNAYVRDTIRIMEEEGESPERIQTLLHAASLLEEIVVRHPDYPKYFYTLARAYTVLTAADPERKPEHLERAEMYYQRAYALVPEYPEAVQVYAGILTIKGDYESAVTLLEESLAKSDVPSTHFYLGLALFQIGPERYPDALYHLQQAETKTGPKLMVTLYRKLLAAFLKDGDIQRSRTAIQRLFEIDPDRTPAYQEIESVLNRAR